ncbi:Lrp/AsnC family transcriptional regulator [Urechidicola vernalis]|uniref:Lrp/AsnC family transcriptional regulator n=1 Tax=Urechidicola vernalis TaxID=3075600 RepID=A0ABU2Y6Q4_9FLAO|nr:Lrp/AsnC family transcriptional regulator [Urechidicola sp. P050]MDT0553876.1 Lrp/AsnC family transcriptional regulator [Urechidicola sp. P050]
MLDNTDKSLLVLLQKNAKYTIKELAAKLNLTATPIFERIKRLENEGYIQNYKAVVDRKKIGLSLITFCNVSLKNHETTMIAKFEKDIVQFSEVIECYHIAGMYDYLIKVMVKDMDEYQEFVAKKLASLENLGQVQSSFVMTEVKTNASLPVE